MQTKLHTKFFRNLLMLAVFLTATFNVTAQLIGWDASTVPNGTFGASPWTPSTLNARLNTAGLIRGANIGQGSTPANFCWGGAEGWSTTAADASSFYFTFQVSTGYKANLSSISSATRRSATGPTGCSVWYSINGGAYIKITDWSTTSTTGTTGTANSASLTGIAALQNIPTGTSVKFRLSPNGTTGNYYLTGGTASLQINGTVVPAVVISSVLSGTTAICAGGSADISVAITGGTGPYKLVYSDGSVQTTINNYVSGTAIPVTPTGTRTYTVISVTDANNVLSTTNTGSAIITVNPLPTVTATNITTCATGAVALTGGSPAGGTYSIPNPYSGPTTTFTYTYTNANDCSKTSAVYTFTRNTAITIIDQPVTTTQTTCLGSTFSPVMVNASGSGTLSYQWYSNTTASTTGGTPLTTAPHISNGSRSASFTPLATAVGTTYYYVTITNSCGTVKSANTTGVFTVEAQPAAGTITSNQTICAGFMPDDITLSGNTAGVVRWQLANDSGFTSGVQDISLTANVLPGTTIGNVLQTTYVRALIKNTSCLEVPTAPAEIKIKTTTWSGSWDNGIPDDHTTVVFAADYSSTTNLSACVVIVNSGTIIINSNHTLTIENALNVVGGSMTFENNSNLIQVNEANNSGNITYKRSAMPMIGYDYTYWSSPVDFQILADFSPDTRFDKYLWWNATTYDWDVITAPGITPMEIGKGYIIRAPFWYDSTRRTFTGNFTGIPNNGNYTVPVVVTDPLKNFNLLGNPYPSALSADAFMSDAENAAALGTGSTIYLWTHNTPITAQAYDSSDYALYNYTGSTGTAPAAGLNNNRPNGFIAAGQAFMISGLTTGTAVFKNSMRHTTNNQFFKNSQGSIEKNRLWLALKNSSGVYKETLIGYVENATNGLDRGFDGENISAVNGFNLYTIANETKLTIQGRALPFDESEILPLGYIAATAGNFEIGLEDFDGLFTQHSVYLEDTQLHIIHDLKQSDYAFTTTGGTFESRFILRFTNTLLETNDPISNDNDLIVYKNQNGLFVRSGSRLISKVTIYDISGRLLQTETAVNAKETTIPNQFSTAVLLVKVALENGLTSLHKIIN